MRAKPAKKKLIAPEKQFRGFRAMREKDVKRICKMGGKATVAKYGSSHMARLGSAGGKAVRKSEV